MQKPKLKELKESAPGYAVLSFSLLAEILAFLPLNTKTSSALNQFHRLSEDTNPNSSSFPAEETEGRTGWVIYPRSHS